MTAAGSADLVVISGLWGLFAAGVSTYCIRIARQITYVTLSDGRRKERLVPLTLRLLLPFTPGLRSYAVHPRLATTRTAADRRLVAAGFEGVLSGAEFLALRVLYPLVYGSLAGALLLLLSATLDLGFLTPARWPLILLLYLLCALAPVMWLNSAVAARQRAIRRALPFLLDILTLSVEAGLDFMTALQRHVERAEVDALGEELLRVIREIQLGKTRREALRDMSTRVNFSDLRTVINALVQADELGVSIGSILRIQADQIRQRRFERAERLAHEAPVKLLFPLLVFIFPSVFLILLGPVLRQIFIRGF